MPFSPNRPERPDIDPAAHILGLHRILPMAYRQEDLTPLWNERAARFSANGEDAAALMDMSVMLQSMGKPVEARMLMDEAITIRKDFAIIHGDGTGLRILAFVTAGDFMANTPIDFLLNGSNAILWLHYVSGDTVDLCDLPDHDVAFFGIAEADDHQQVLVRMATLLSDFDSPVLNRDPGLIATLTRDGVSGMLAGEASILAPRASRVSRTDLKALAVGDAPCDSHPQGYAFPFIVRPVGTHAGAGMERIIGAADLDVYLATQALDQFYIAPFIDYRGSDGLFCKQRIVLIDGKPFPAHLALSDHWMVHYLSAGMEESAAKRVVEAAWMESFDTDFAVRHAAAFDALYRHVGLDYFGIDCVELPDGRLLVFELDIAMVVHDMDDPQTFPYKKVAMQRLFDAFVEAADRKRRESLAATV